MVMVTLCAKQLLVALTDSVVLSVYITAALCLLIRPCMLCTAYRIPCTIYTSCTTVHTLSITVHTCTLNISLLKILCEHMSSV